MKWLFFLPQPIQKYISGNVSRHVLLTVLLPLSFSSIFGTLFIAAQYYPGGYDWQREVISHLISPRYNPDGYLVPLCGMAASALFCLPVASYIAVRLQPISLRLSQWVSVGLGLGIFLVVTVTLPFNVESMPKALHWVHEGLARVGAVGVVGGMLCCSICGMKDWFRCFGGQRTLHPVMVFTWVSFTVVPIVCGVLSGILKVARKADVAWAVAIRAELKQTAIWQLAFWEWVGIVGFVIFMTLSVMLLPTKIRLNDE